VRSLPLGGANCPKPAILGDIPKTRTLDFTWVFEVCARVQIPSAPPKFLLKSLVRVRPAGRDDIAYVSQYLAPRNRLRGVGPPALNQRFFLNEKNAFIESEHFALRPESLHREVKRISVDVGDARYDALD